jgi:hypothetical protein
MSIVDNQYRTITCNGSDCDKTVTFDLKQVETAVKENPWLENTRLVNRLSDGRVFAYCSDTCEVKAVTTGAHNKEEKKVVEMPTGSAREAILRAAQAAKAAEEGAKALKEGRPVNIQPATS